MVRPNPRYGTEIVFTDMDGYSRNLALEERLQREDVANRIYDTPFKGKRNPVQAPVPSWWDSNFGWRTNNEYTDNEALEYLNIALKYYTAKVEYQSYQCHHYPRDTSACQHAAQYNGTVSNIARLIEQVKKQIAEDTKINGNGFQLFPEAFAEEAQPVTIPTLSPQTSQIINDVSNQKIIAPAWFVNNNVNWIINGQITEQDFLIAYNHQVGAGNIYPAEATVNESITDNMVTQRLDNFSIVNGRAIGQITFTATENFNPNYYGKNLVNVIQFKTPNGVDILPFIKQNTLRFTATERTETIQYDEGMENNTRATLESFVWSDVTTPNPFSKTLSYEISETDEPKPVGVAGIMGAGVGGAIGILVLLGFIADSRRKK